MIRGAQISDWEALKTLWQQTFEESQSFLDWFFRERFLPEFCFLAEENKTIVSALHGFPTHIRIRNRILPCLIVSGVATLPEWRHKGYMRAVFSAFAKEMRARGIPLVIYRPVDMAIYEPLGHYAVSDALFFTQAIPACTPAIAAQAENVQDMSLSADLSGLYRCYSEFARQYSCMIAKSYPDFAFKFSDYAADDGRCLAVTDDDSQIIGYCVYYETDSEVSGEEFVASSPAGYGQLYAAMQFCAAGKRLSLRLPTDAPSLGDSASLTKAPHCALGALDVSALLSATGLTAHGAIEVTDAFLPENAGIYTLNGAPSHAPAQLRISSGRLAQWAVGYRSMAEIVHTGHASVLDAEIIPALDTLQKTACYTIDEY